MFLTEYDEKLHEQTLREEGRMEGIGQGIEQGELKKAKKMAAAMLKDGMEPDKVKKYSELSGEQWDELLKSLFLINETAGRGSCNSGFYPLPG